MSESSEEKLSRRSFLKILGVGTAAVLLGKLADKEEAQNLEGVRPNELIFANSKIELRASPIPGIVDIIDLKTKRLVNNLVLLVSWEDESGIHYNNSEIQASPIMISREERAGLIYKFEKEETSPARQPASGLTVELQFSDKEGSIAMRPQIRENSNNLKGIKIGIGCFFGINQGVNRAEIFKSGQTLTVTPQEGTYTQEGQLGSFEVFENSGSFTLKSAYPDMPSLSLSLDSTSASYGRVDIESRNSPYNPEHQGLHENYIRQTGRREWIEAGILYAPPEETFILSLGE